MLNGRGEGIQAHLLSPMKDCQGEDRSSGSFISTCACCVCRVSVSKTHFPPSSVLCSHILLCSGQNCPFSSDVRQQPGRSRALEIRDVHPSLLHLLLLLPCPPLTPLLITCHIKSKNGITKNKKNWQQQHSWESEIAPCLLFLSLTLPPHSQSSVRKMRESDAGLTIINQFPLFQDQTDSCQVSYIIKASLRGCAHHICDMVLF